ncbi:hypothetical protein RF11_05874 [Thelohanellus kitauei]|uniref:Uncharacterized protein n=1 Tax=Thelohanellus kitauei TaxID=669202 RepID=A0A0C2J433_THEKT|nr:hypothetical protein RF11_05874 [Thelohanellus kitauei]
MRVFDISLLIRREIDTIETPKEILQELSLKLINFIYAVEDRQTNSNREERREFIQIDSYNNNDVVFNHRRNYGTLIDGPWILGLIECTIQEDGSCKSSEIRIFIINRRDAQTIRPITRQELSAGSTNRNGMEWKIIRHKIIKPTRKPSDDLLTSHLHEYM